MDGPLKELAKLEKLTSSAPSAKGKAPSIHDSLDALLSSLHEVKSRLDSGPASDEDFDAVAKLVENSKKEIDERQKEIYNSLARFGKVLDKVRTPSYVSHPVAQLWPA